MATRIEPTPILRGKDAELLRKELANNRYSRKHAQFLEECRRIYDHGTRQDKGRETG